MGDGVDSDDRPHRLVFLGPPGAGKGTQCARLAEELKVPHISTGQILRDSVGRGEGLGAEVKAFLDAGELVPDDLMVRLIRQRLEDADCMNGFILDGFPRTVEQAKQLDAMLTELGMNLTEIIEVLVPEEELLNRLTKRAKEQGRSDDTKEVISRRLQVYYAATLPVSEYYSKTSGLRQVDGIGTVEEVERRLRQALR